MCYNKDVVRTATLHIYEVSIIKQKELKNKTTQKTKKKGRCKEWKVQVRLQVRLQRLNIPRR